MKAPLYHTRTAGAIQSVRMILSYLFVLVNVWQSVLADSDACSNSLTLSSQSDVNNLTSCDNFEGSITISSSFNGAVTLNGVQQLKGSFIAEGVSGLTAIVAPDLTQVEGSITINNLDSLSTITMGALSQISLGMTITGNPELKSLGFQELEEVDGQLLLTGSFNSVSLPALDQVQGQTTIKSSGSMSCGALDKLRSNGVFRGSYSCSGSSSGLSAGAKAGIAIGVILGVLLVLLGLWFFLRRRRQGRRTSWAKSTTSAASTPSAASTHNEKPISSVTPSPVEEPPLQMPRKPVGSAIFLDSRPIHEAANAPTPVREYHELDAGPVVGSHQRPIHADN